MKPVRTFFALGLAVGACLLAAGCASKAQREARFQAGAQAFMDQQRFPDAIIQYRNALQLTPNSPQLEYELGQAYTKNQQYQAAFSAFNRALSLQPDNEKAQMAIGEFYLVAREYPKATAAAQADLAKHPGDPQATILLANVEAAQGNGAAAVQRLQDLLRQEPKSVSAHLSLGILYAALQQLPQAQQQFQQAVGLDPHSVPARNDIAGLLAEEGNLTGAEAAYQSNVAGNPKSVSALQAYASFLMARRRYGAAEPLYKQMEALQHNSPQSQFALASFYATQGKTAAAVAIDQAVARQAPTFVEAREQWAEIELQNKHFAQAGQVLDALLKDQPNDVNALILLARVELQQHHPGHALTTLASAQRLNPNLAQVAFEQGQAYEQQNKLDLAQDSLIQAVTLNGQFFDAQSALAELMLNKGDSQSALTYAQRMEALAPNRPEGYFFAGSALANLGQLPAAAVAFQRYIALNPKSSLGPGHLGFVYLMERRYADANGMFEQALKLDPGDADALAGLMSLYQAQGQLSKAVPRLQQQLAAANAAHLPPATVAVINDQLARAYVQQKQVPQAEATLKLALSEDPRNYDTYVLLGTLYAQRQDFAGAQAQFAKAAAASPDSAGLWTLVGMLDEQVHQPAQAVQAYQHALSLDPSNGVADNNLASLYTADDQHLQEALVLAQRAKRALPTVANVNDTLGWVYVQQGVYQLAIPLLQQAVASQPKTTDFRVHLATALYRDGQKQEARAQLNQAIKLDQGLARQSDIQQMLRN